MVLGKYLAGSVDSCEAVAQARGATYFSMFDWHVVQSQLGGDQMWNINKAFLDQQVAAGKTFTFTSDPLLEAATSYTRQEYNYLQSLGYEIEPGKGGYFNAVK